MATFPKVVEVHGNVSPDRALTAEISDELIAPDAFTSNLKLLELTVCPERAFTPLMSLELTDRVLFASPTRKPIDTGDGFTDPLTPTSVTVMRWLSGTLVNVTRTSLPTAAAVAVPNGVTLTVPVTLTVLLN